jgi:hypothetical protein
LGNSAVSRVSTCNYAPVRRRTRFQARFAQDRGSFRIHRRTTINSKHSVRFHFPDNCQQRMGRKKNLGRSGTTTGIDYLVRSFNYQPGAGSAKSCTGAVVEFSNIQRKRRKHRTSCRLRYPKAFAATETQQVLASTCVYLIISAFAVFSPTRAILIFT